MELVIQTAMIGSAPSPTTCFSRFSFASAASAPQRAPACYRDHWPHLPDLTFRDIPAGEINSALARIARRTAVSLLEIHLMSSAERKLDDAHAKSLLRAAARLSPERLVLVLLPCTVTKRGRAVTMRLPCFHRATSIELDTRSLRIMWPLEGKLPVLKMLSISGNIVDIGAFLNRCPRLRVLRIIFRGVDPGSLEAELTAPEAAATLGLTVSCLGIKIDDFNKKHSVDGTRLASLLRVAARISPEELVFASRFSCLSQHLDADMPCFRRTTSIEMDFYAIRYTQLPADEFSALERLALKGCTLTDLATMIIRCPRLRVLKVTIDKSAGDVTVHSVSLEELDLKVHRDTECQSIHIVTPLLKELKLYVDGKTKVDVFIAAPMVEKVWWRRLYTLLPLIFGFWWLENMRFDTIESYKHKDEEGICSQLPRVHVLSIDISSYNPNMGVAVDFAHEMEKLLVINFSVLELHLDDARGHGFGAFVFRLLRMRHIQTTTQKLKIVLPWWCEIPQASKCLENCLCDEPKDWRRQSISLTHLEEVEINNFRGGDHEVDFLRLIFRCAPMLTRMIIKLAYQIKQSEIEGCVRAIYNVYLVYPSVNCFVYISSGEKWSCQSGLQALPIEFQ